MVSYHDWARSWGMLRLGVSAESFESHIRTTILKEKKHIVSCLPEATRKFQRRAGKLWPSRPLRRPSVTKEDEPVLELSACNGGGEVEARKVESKLLYFSIVRTFLFVFFTFRLFDVTIVWVSKHCSTFDFSKVPTFHFLKSFVTICWKIRQHKLSSTGVASSSHVA